MQTLSALGQVVRACGLPVIIGGDWQISPEVLAQSKFPHRVGAEIVAPSSPTNLRSGSTLDYFLVSRSIRAAVVSVETRTDLYLSPHVPVVATISTRVALGYSTVMAQPRLLPSGDPRGPMPRAATVDWVDFEGHECDSAHMLKLWHVSFAFEISLVLGSRKKAYGNDSIQDQMCQSESNLNENC